MAKAVVDKDACVGCETCVGTCPVEAISMVDGKALVDESCIECGSCVSVCPVYCTASPHSLFSSRLIISISTPPYVVVLCCY